jgi:hypothetical protein
VKELREVRPGWALVAVCAPVVVVGLVCAVVYRSREMFYVSVFGAAFMLMALPFYVILISLFWRIPVLVIGSIELLWRWARSFFVQKK